jgi:hypothetical protein
MKVEERLETEVHAVTNVLSIARQMEEISA